MKPRRILAPIDFSPPSLTAAELAAGWARAWGAELHLVHVWWAGLAPEMVAREASLRASRDALEERLRNEAIRIAASDQVVHPHLELAASPSLAIAELSRRFEIDLVVAGAHGRRGLRRWALGSVTESLARDLPVDLLCVRQRASSTERLPERLLLPVDFSGPSRRAVARAVELAGPSATLSLVHVLEELDHPGYFDLFDLQPVRDSDGEIIEGVEERLQEWADEIRDRVAAVETQVLRGRPAEAVVHYAGEWSADWIVISSHGRHGVEAYLTGSVTQRVLQRSSLPVLVVPGLDRE